MAARGYVPEQRCQAAARVRGVVDDLVAGHEVEVLLREGRALQVGLHQVQVGQVAQAGVGHVDAL